MNHIVGIDLGTTNSLCGIFVDGEPKLIPNSHGEILTPSVVALLEDDRILVGAAAREYRVTHPERTASRFKRYMGTQQLIKIGKKSFTAPELSAFVLKSLKADAEAFLKRPVTDAVITVPAYFNDLQRKSTKLAGEIAGLNVRRMINEPTAAALTYGFHDRGTAKHLLVIDLGGGTFDVTLMEVFEGTLEIVSTAGANFLGGEDFTDRIVSECLKSINRSLELAEMSEPLRVARLREECERAKRQLAELEKVTIRIPDRIGEFRSDSSTTVIDRATFKEFVLPIMERMLGPIHRTLRDGKRSIDQVDELIFVGGATRMLCLHEFLAEHLNAKPIMTYNPDEVVGLGAAVQAALLSQDRAVDDMVMTDVCPHTLGIEVTKEFGNEFTNGFFSPIIDRNTTIPVSKEEVYSTLYPNQTSVSVRVYQGESRKVEGNLFLGELVVKGFPVGPKGQQFIVRFTYDPSGVLEVEAFILATGKAFRTVLNQQKAGLSEAEVQKILEKMKKIKYFPREDTDNQRLLLYCERLFGEVEMDVRSDLEMVVDSFDRAMRGADKEEFEMVKQSLLEFLSTIGFPYQQEEQ